MTPRFKSRFRERFPEWVLGIGTIVWGILALLNPAVFNQQYYYVLSLILSYPFWGIFAISTGLVRCTALFVNGIWRNTAHIRAITAIFSTFIWASLLMASFAGGQGARPLGIAIFSMLLAFDIAAVWWAAGDAKIADVVHKSVKSNGDGN